MHAISVSARVVALPLLVTLMLAGCGGGGSSGGGGGGGSSTPSLPIAEFTASPLTVQVGSPVQFTDGSTGATGWQWDFNSDGTPEDYGQNPSHVYTAPGIYDVTLQVSNAAGINTRLRMAYITVTPPPPVAEFVASPTTLTLGSSVQFTDQSTNATAWSWDFNNDGTADSTAQNPAHVYGAAGTYTVVLTASNSGGNNVRTRAAYITVNPPPSTTVDIDVDTDRNGSVDNAADEAGERVQEAQLQRERNAELRTSRDQQVEQVRTLADEVFGLNLRLTATRERYESLLRDNATMRSFLASKGLPTDPKQMVVNTQPAEPLVAVVMDIRPGERGASELVQISAGTDDGLEIGHRLTLFRDSKYLGQIELTYVTPDLAVGSVIPDLKAKNAVIQKGDNATTKF